jgi:hypothetical protein
VLIDIDERLESSDDMTSSSDRYPEKKRGSLQRSVIVADRRGGSTRIRKSRVLS